MLKDLVSKCRLYYRLRKEVQASGGRVCLVHQMGKVGSSSVYYSLKDKLDMPVYHTHFFSVQGIQNAKAFFRDANAAVPYNILFSQVLRRLLPIMHPTIITLVRDPIAREISGYFQLGDRVFHALQEVDGQLVNDNETILQEVQTLILKLRDPNHYIHTWFENELNSVFGIDVYKIPFDFEKGFVRVFGDRGTVLCFRLRDLDRSFQEGIYSTFGRDLNIQLTHSNISRDKRYSELWKYVSENIRIPVGGCKDIYNTQLGRHFFNDISDELIKKWSA